MNDHDLTQESHPTGTPIEEMARAIGDLWSQVVQTGSDYVVFYDHYGSPARVRYTDDGYLIAWADDAAEEPVWNESERTFDSPREAALRAFQGPKLGA